MVTFDEILHRMIVDAKNYSPTMNITQGTETYIRFACAASAIWGLYKQIGWTLDQIFPTTMSVESLEKFAADHNLNVSALTPGDLLTFILSYIRTPAAGGKPADYERWALEASSTGKASTLSASMITGTLAALSGANLLKPHDQQGVGFTVSDGDTEKNLIIDFGGPKKIMGVGLGFITYRGGKFSVWRNDATADWVKLGELSAGFGWQQLNFAETEVEKLRIKVESVGSLESWQEESLNAIKCTGLEVYENSTADESATAAQCLKNYNGVGTAMILVEPMTLSMRCCEAIRTYCEDEGPVAPRELYVEVPASIVTDLRVVVTGFNDLDIDGFRDDVTKYFASLTPGKMLIPAQIVVYAIQHGATFAHVYGSFNGSASAEITDIVSCQANEIFTLGNLVVE